jgi:enoyl-CoA hydratase/carnithine racemase
VTDADAPLVVVERDGSVAVVLLNRPKQLNALSAPLMDELVSALRELDDDGAIRCVVLGGNERAFAAGADVSELAEGTPIQLYENRRIEQWDAIRALRTPLVAAVSGYCLGGGCELAMVCDLIVASETAQFGQPEINLGVMPGAGGTQRLTHAVGKSVAMDVILSGRFLTADEALRAGRRRGGVARRGEARCARDRREEPCRGAPRQGRDRQGVRGAAVRRRRVRAARVLPLARIGGRERGAFGVRREAQAGLQGQVGP